MEEILASIKRVIAEDGRPAARPGPRLASRPRRRARLPPAEDDVLELRIRSARATSLVSDDAAVASRQSLAALAALRERARDARPGRRRPARSGGARDAAADAQGLARPQPARHGRGAGHPRDRPDHRASRF